MIENAKKTEPSFQVKEVRNEDILDFKKWWPDYFVQLPKSNEDKMLSFVVNKYRHFVYKSELNGYAQALPFIDTNVTSTFRLKKTNTVTFPVIKPYIGKVPIKKEKIQAVSYTHLDVYKRQLPGSTHTPVFYISRLVCRTLNLTSVENRTLSARH